MPNVEKVKGPNKYFEKWNPPQGKRRNEKDQPLFLRVFS